MLTTRNVPKKKESAIADSFNTYKAKIFIERQM